MNYHEMAQKKFATLIDEKVLKDLKAFAASSDRSISGVVTEAIAEYLDRVKVRPAFRSAMDEVLEDHAALLKRLAK